MDTSMLHKKSIVGSLSFAFLAIFLFGDNAKASQIRLEDSNNPNLQSFSCFPQEFDIPTVRKRPSSALTRSRSYMGFTRNSEKPEMSPEEKRQRVSDLIKRNSPHTVKDIINLIKGDHYFAIFSPKVPDSTLPNSTSSQQKADVLEEEDVLEEAAVLEEEDVLDEKNKTIKRLTIGALIDFHNYDNDMYPISTVGYYKGDMECSFFVVSKNEKDLKECITKLGALLDQDSVIFGGRGQIFLYENSSKHNQENQPAYNDNCFFSPRNNSSTEKAQWIKQIAFPSFMVLPSPSDNCTGFYIGPIDRDEDSDDDDDAIEWLWLRFISEEELKKLPEEELMEPKENEDGTESFLFPDPDSFLLSSPHLRLSANSFLGEIPA